MHFLLTHIPFTVLLWALIYISDYMLTRLTAGMYYNGADLHVTYERGIELNPIHQRDIAMLRWISPRFLMVLVLSSLGLGLFGFYARMAGQNFMFQVLLGGWLLAEAVVHIRHFRNLATFHYLKDSEGVSGHIQYDQWLSYRISTIDCLSFALLYLLLYLLFPRPFFLGGVIACVGLGLYHWLLGSRVRRKKARSLQTGFDS